MFRRAIPSVVLFLLTSSVLGAPVPPQPKPDDSVSPSAMRLLQQRKVQKELKLSAEQRIVILDGLADLEEEFDKKLEILGRNPNAPDDAFDKLDREHHKAIEKLLSDTATKNLTAAQRTRLRQLDCRIRGVAAFTDQRVEKVLQLTEAQKKQATELSEKLKNEFERYLDGGNGMDDETKRRADLFAFRKDVLKKMEATLTADQKTSWTVLTGDAPTGFVVDELWLRVEEDSDLLGVALPPLPPLPPPPPPVAPNPPK
jgi:hypothetical protein